MNFLELIFKNARITISAVLILALFFPQLCNAQSHQYLLKNVGTKDSLYSQILKETRSIYVQFPSGYTSESTLRYPVVYVFDGEVFLPTVYDVQNYYSGGFTPEMIIVGVSNDKNRTRDLTPSKIKTKYGMPFNEENGNADLFLSFLETELIPFVEKNYPVTTHRTLMGHSYAGLFTLYTLLNKSFLFSNYVAIDPSLDWDDQKLIKEAEKIFEEKTFKNKSLYMSLSGQLHMQNSKITIENVMQDTSEYTVFARSNIQFSKIAEKAVRNGLDFQWKFYPKDIHGTIPLPSIMDGLVRVFEWYQWENTDKINSFDTSIEEYQSIVAHREAKLKEHLGYFEPPYPEEIFNTLGYMNMDMQEIQKSKMFFELAIKYYPESVNALDSMADYYETNGDLVSALSYAKKANKLKSSEYLLNKIEDLKKKIEKSKQE